MKIYVMEVDDIIRDIIPSGIDIKVVDYADADDTLGPRFTLSLYGEFSIEPIKLAHLVNRKINLLCNSKGFGVLYHVPLDSIMLMCEISTIEYIDNKVKMVLVGERCYNPKVDESYKQLEDGDTEPWYNRTDVKSLERYNAHKPFIYPDRMRGDII